jgi:hypothetical protein
MELELTTQAQKSKTKKMKPKIVKLSAVFLFLIFIGAGCQKDEIEYADESIVVDNHPGVSVYKTNGDYVNYIAVDTDSLGNISGSPDYTYSSSTVGVRKNGEVYFKNRYVLKSGYIVGYLYIDHAFTNITLKEFVEYNKENGVAGWSDSLIYSRIIDSDPFTEFYYMGCLNCPIKEFTLGEINEMIKSGTIEEYFTKLK